MQPAVPVWGWNVIIVISVVAQGVTRELLDQLPGSLTNSDGVCLYMEVCSLP